MNENINKILDIDPESQKSTAQEKKKESIGAYIVNIITCMLFPIMVIWLGPKYLLKREYIKGIMIIIITVVWFLIVLSIFDLI
jgi:presenilin-like A22 family membrane protease